MEITFVKLLKWSVACVVTSSVAYIIGYSTMQVLHAIVQSFK